MRFIEEIKRRNVGRVAILYLVVCWLILEPVHVIFHMLEVPIWANRLVILLMALGFPPAVIFAWVYEITPEGLKPTDQVPHGQSIRRATGRRLDFAIIAVLALALTYFVVDKFWLQGHRAQEAHVDGESPTGPRERIRAKSIAVLPFTDLSEKRDQEYFADGLADELLDVLAKLPGLRIIGRTSSFQFKGKAEDLRSIGAKLGAAHIVEGSVRRSGEHLRVTAQLIRAADGAHEWSGTYDRNAEDVLQLQSEIATALGRALELSVADSLSQTISITRNLEAQDSYFRGMHALDSYTAEGCEEAVTDLQRAIELDPQFLRAREWLGMAHLIQVATGFVAADIGFAQLREDASRILELDPHSSVAHSLLARLHMLHTWDWAAAQREIDTALASGPNDWGALHSAGDLALVLGDLNKSERLFRAALVSDPLSSDSLTELSQVLAAMDRFPAAEAEVRRGLDINPRYVYGHFELGGILLAQRRSEEALHEYEQEVPVGSKYPGLAKALHALGRDEESKAALDRAIAEYPDDQAVEIAAAFAYQGDTDRAFEWLDRACQVKNIDLQYLRAFWEFRKLKADPRYSALLRKMNLTG
jgi:TolB-like protein